MIEANANESIELDIIVSNYTHTHTNYTKSAYTCTLTIPKYLTDACTGNGNIAISQ